MYTPIFIVIFGLTAHQAIPITKVRIFDCLIISIFSFKKIVNKNFRLQLVGWE